MMMRLLLISIWRRVLRRIVRWRRFIVALILRRRQLGSGSGGRSRLNVLLLLLLVLLLLLLLESHARVGAGNAHAGHTRVERTTRIGHRRRTDRRGGGCCDRWRFRSGCH